MYKLNIDCGTSNEKYVFKSEKDYRIFMSEVDQERQGFSEELLKKGILNFGIDCYTLDVYDTDLVLVRYEEDFGRSGNLSGLFITDKKLLENLKGVRIDFGEAFGKHSEVCSSETYENCKVVEASPEDLKALIRVFGEGTIEGYNPLEYLYDY